MKTSSKLVVVFAVISLVLPKATKAVVIEDMFTAATLNPMWSLDASASAGAITFSDGFARWNNAGNYAYAHLETSADTTGGLRVDAIMRQDGYPVSTWAMGVTIYFNANNWVGIRQGAASGQQGWLRYGFINGVSIYDATVGAGPNLLRGACLISGVELTATEIKFYGSSTNPLLDHYGKTGDAALAAESLISGLTLARPTNFTGNALVIIGKGYTGPGYGNPDLDNEITSTNFALACIDYARIEVIPEPATVCLFGLGALSLLRRKM